MRAVSGTGFRMRQRAKVVLDPQARAFQRELGAHDLSKMGGTRMPKSIEGEGPIAYSLIPYNTGGRARRALIDRTPRLVISRARATTEYPGPHVLTPERGKSVNLGGIVTPGWPGMFAGNGRVSFYEPLKEEGKEGETHKHVGTYTRNKQTGLLEPS